MPTADANRNRVIFQSDFLYTGPSPATGKHYTFGTGSQDIVGSGTTNLISGLYRIQDISYGFNIARTDVNQFGELAAIDRIILEQPTVNIQFSYLQANLYNEKTMGFTITSGATPISAFASILDKTKDEKNYFIRRSAEGLDAITVNPASGNFVYAVGNGFISSFSTEGSVGNFARTTIGIDALNMEFEENVSGNNIPAVNPVDGTAITANKYELPTALSSPVHLSGVSALRPGDITVSIGNNEGGVNIDDMKIQSYNITYDIARDPLQKLGSKYAFSREIRYPSNATATVTADIGSSQSGSLIQMITDNKDYTVEVKVNHPSLASTVVCDYKLLGAKLDSHAYTSSIGANNSVTLTFTTQIGASGQTTKGVFLSGWN